MRFHHIPIGWNLRLNVYYFLASTCWYKDEGKWLGDVFDIFFEKDIQLWILKSSFNKIRERYINEMSLDPTPTQNQSTIFWNYWYLTNLYL